MKFAHRTITRLAAVFALAAAATSAYAQHGDPRGFDDGYRAGQQDARDDRRDERRGPPWTRIRILEAEYGARGRMCDARRAVRREVERNRGSINVGNHLCGDPVGGVDKRLRVVYRCDNSGPARVTARENERLRLRCSR